MSLGRPALHPERALVLLTLAAWGGVVLGAFHSDDFASVVSDPATSDLGLLPSRILHGVRPLLRASFALDHLLWGFRPGGFLLTNLLLHVATVLGVHALARRRLDTLGAFLAAALFSLQPANVEVVAWVSGRSTGLCTALLVAALWVNGGGRWRAVPRAVLVALLLLGACLAKEVALVAPLLLLLWERTRSPEEPPGALRPSAALGVALLAGAVLALSGRYRELLAHSLALRSPAENLVASAEVLPAVLGLWVRPWALALPRTASTGDLAPAWVGAMVVLALAGLAWRFRGRAPPVALAAGWILIALLPTHSLVAKTELVTAKPLYLAWIGPSLLLGWALAALSRRLADGRRRWLVPAGLAVTLGAAGVLAAVEVATWRDPMTLALRAVAQSPADPFSWNALGAALQSAGRQREAVEAFRQATILDPSSARMRQHLSMALLLCGDCPEEGGSFP
ncbi:MAG TPA: hypothetical protein VMH40_05950 [Myxococcaceae bacterium]|nr:hypothetical protein [Myxococcaceae bacterium]